MPVLITFLVCASIKGTRIGYIAENASNAFPDRLHVNIKERKHIASITISVPKLFPNALTGYCYYAEDVEH